MTNEYGVNVQLSYNRNAAYFLPKYREEFEKMMKQKGKTTTPIEISIAESLCRIADSLEELIDMAKEQNSCDCCSKETDQDIEDYLDQLLSPSRKKTSPDEIFAVSIDPAKQPEKVPIGRFDEYETFTVDDEVIFEIPNTDMAVSCSFGKLIEIGGHQYLFGQGLVVLLDPDDELREFQEKDFQKVLRFLDSAKRTILCGSAKKDVYRLK